MSKMKIQQNSNVRRSVGRFTWNLLSHLPRFIKGPIIRRMFTVDRDLSSNLVFKKAETPEEIEEAFKLAYEAYSDRGLVTDSEVKMRITKYHALPTTSLLIAKLNNEVIATISIICDSGLGLPVEKLFNIDFLRKKSVRIAEISTLAIRRGHRTQRGKLLLALCKFMNEYCLDILGVDIIVATVHPEVKDFYRCVLLFDDIENGKAKAYDFVQGAAASAHYLKLGKVHAEQMEKIYRRAPSSRNLFHYFHLDEFDNFKFPERPFYSAHDLTFTPNLIDYFFKHKTEVINEFSDKERQTVSNLYFHSEYKEVFGVFDSKDGSANRKMARFQAHCPVRFYYLSNKTEYFSGMGLEISRGGIKAKIENYKLKSPSQSNEVVVLVNISKDTTLAIAGEIIWDNSEMSMIGIWFNQFIPKQWHNFLNHLEDELVTAAKSQTFGSVVNTKAQTN